jgi:hypothetical protein
MEISKQNSLKEHVFKCPICYEMFSNIHKPLLIPCGHTICSNCLEQLKKMAKEDDESGYTSQENDLDISLSEDSDDEDEDDDDEEDNEEEEESEDTDNSIESEANFIEIVESKVEKDLHHENEQNRKLRLKCSICRKKMKIYPNEIIDNKNILQLLDIMVNTSEINNPPIEEKLVKVFCKHCKIIDTESGHLQLHEQHRSYLLYLDEQEFTQLKKVISTDISKNELVVQKLKKLIDTIYHNDEFKTAKEYLTDYFKMYTRMIYLKNKTFKNSAKLYSKFTSLLDDGKFDKAELCLETSVELANKYYQSVGKIVSFQDDIAARLIKDKTLVLDISIKYLNFLASSKHTKQIDSFKKFVTYASNSLECIYIFDLRAMIKTYIPYAKVFEIFDETKPNNYNLGKNYSEWTDIDENGRFLIILGKSGMSSAKFRMFDLMERKLLFRPNVPEKFEVFDSYLYNGRLYILGGGRDNIPVPKCFFYDLDGGYWYNLPDLQINRFRKTLTVFNNTFYAFSGHGSNENYKFEALNLDCEFKWRVFEIKNYHASLNHPLSGFVSDKYLLILGGQEIDSYQSVLKGYVIDMKKEECVEEFEINKTECYESIGNFNGYLVGAETEGNFHRFDIYKNSNKLKTLI